MNSLFPDKSVRESVQRVLQLPQAVRPGLESRYSVYDSQQALLGSSRGACFAALRPLIRRYEKAIAYVGYHLPKEKVVGPDLYRRWLELGTEVGILPVDLDVEGLLREGTFYLEVLDPELTASRAYMMLTFIRWVREAPCIVEGTIDLVDRGGRDFWAAVTVCHKDHALYPDQSLLPFAGPYSFIFEDIPRTELSEGYRRSLADLWRDVGVVRRLHTLCLSPELIDNRPFLSTHLAQNWQGYLLHSRTMKPTVRLVVKDRLMLLADDLIPVIYCGTDAQALELAEQLKKEKSVVEFL